MELKLLKDKFNLLLDMLLATSKVPSDEIFIENSIIMASAKIEGIVLVLSTSLNVILD